METIVLIGGGGHCISCIDVLNLIKAYNVIGILDTSEKVGTEVSGIKVIGTDDDIPDMARKYKNFLISIGQIKSPENRIRVYNLIKKYCGILPVVISSKAYVSRTAVIGEGTIVMHNAVVNAGAQIGKCTIINTGALIEHEAIINDFCHISTHAVVNGQVMVGKKSFLGSNSVIANNVSLPDEIIVAAGTCVLKDPVKSGIYIGNPARKTGGS